MRRRGGGRAYEGVPYSDHREHLMVERLRTTRALIPTLSPVAEVDGETVGHVLPIAALIRGALAGVAGLVAHPPGRLDR